jgi:hypothetical protein
MIRRISGISKVTITQTMAKSSPIWDLFHHEEGSLCERGTNLQYRRFCRM